MRAIVLSGALFLVGCPPASSTDCSTQLEPLTDQVASKLLSYESGCVTDQDCALIDPSISCLQGCPAAVLASQAMIASMDLMNSDSELCSGLICHISIGCNPTHAFCTSLGTCANADGSDAGVPDAGPDAGPSMSDAGDTTGDGGP